LHKSSKPALLGDFFHFYNGEFLFQFSKQGSGHHFFAMLYQIILTIKAIAIGSSVFFQKVFVNSMSKFKAAQ
jgi:hypothetical protein